jgi:hypothetical protein
LAGFSLLNMTEPSTYIPGSYPAQQKPLARFLPPVPEGVISTWLAASLQSGALVIDPFGAAPQLPIEAARSGYRVIVTANNPVAHFLLASLANPPSQSELRSVIAELAASYRGQERLETHLRSLYLTQCENCGRDIEAEAFIWERDTNIPFAKQYSCPYCGESAVQPTSELDLKLTVQFAADKLHRARALERVVSLDDPDRHHAEEALAMYQPRALYALFNLINRLDSMDLTPPRRRQLEMLLLSTCEMTNSIWAYPGGRIRPKQLTLSPKFYEYNVWKSFENAIREWIPAGDEQYPELSVTSWPELPPTGGGITIYEGRLKDLVGELRKMHLQGVICAVPRPNQAFWTLSALWAGWLWGRDSVRPLKSVLRRRRYDWNWHCVALHSIFDNLAYILDAGTPTFGLIGEAEPGLLTSTIVATEMAGLRLEGFSLRAESSQAQALWQKSSPESYQGQINKQDWISSIAQSAHKFLIQRGEPASYLQIHAAALCDLTQKAWLPRSISEEIEQSPADLYNKVTAAIEMSISHHRGLSHLAGGGKSLEVGQWWISSAIDDDRSAIIPLADRVETEIVQFLLEQPGSRLLDIDRNICSIFPGLLTPGGDLVHIAIESYAVQRPKDSDHWHIRPEDDPAARRLHIASIRNILIEIAARLGFPAHGENPLIWTGAGDDSAYIFHILATAAFGELLTSDRYPAEKSIIVLPGSRANLARLKLKNNSRLNQIFSTGWRFLKFRHVYRLLESPLLDPENFDALLALDPLQDTTQQMRLL